MAFQKLPPAGRLHNLCICHLQLHMADAKIEKIVQSWLSSYCLYTCSHVSLSVAGLGFLPDVMKTDRHAVHVPIQIYSMVNLLWPS
jgi:hypothetical protein